MKERYDTGIWVFEYESRFLEFRGMLGEEHETENEALDTVKKQIEDDIQNGEVERSEKEGFAILYFIGHIQPKEGITLITMTTYVSSAYGNKVLEILKDYDTYQKINITII